MNKNSKIFIAGHNGMVGSSVLRLFKKEFKESKIYTANKNKLNLLNQNQVYKFVKKNKFDSIIICAARAGGIYANNTKKADFIFENLEIQNNLIRAAFLFNVKKLILATNLLIYCDFIISLFCVSLFFKKFLLSSFIPSIYLFILCNLFSIVSTGLGCI